MIIWLPEIVTLEEFDGDYERYTNHLHEIFLNDFVRTKLILDDKPIYYDDRVIDGSGKCECFIHITTCEDDTTNERNFDPRRCERLCWAKPTIENRDDAVAVKVWEVRKKGKNKLNLLIEEERYHVVLTKTKKAYALTTAYYVDRNHMLRKLLKEYRRETS
jgi:hypothetical protein